MKLGKRKFLELKEKKISIEDLNDLYFIDSENDEDKIEADNILKLLNENIWSFQQIVDKFKSIKNAYNLPCLDSLLCNEELFKELIDDNLLTQDDLKYLWHRIDNNYEVSDLYRNSILLTYLLANEIVSFQELIVKFRNCDTFVLILTNKKLFEVLFENTKLAKEDLEYLLNQLYNTNDIDYLCNNTPLTKYILNEFMLDKELVDRLNMMIEDYDGGWYRIRNIHTIFDLIEYRNQDNKEVLNLNELNRKVYLLDILNLNKDQKIELIEVLRANEIAQNRMIQIIDNHLEPNYDFDSLMSCLKKQEKRNLVNI